jgi:NAD(P)-dependent dehydrogenase (short-subunit alcohol dehydrogenase family)
MSIQSVILSSYAEEDTAMGKVWLITGSGNGLGRDIAEAALAAGDSVAAGARRTEELAPLVAQYGGRVMPVTLEVRDEAAAKAAVQLAVDTFGRLDVLVNNAGYGQFAPFEQMSAEDFQAVVDTCFYGVVYTTRAAIPVMRKQKSGHIFQVSSYQVSSVVARLIGQSVFESQTDCAVRLPMRVQ